MKRIKRAVLHSKRIKPERTIWSAFGILDTLVCGHEIYNKGSAGYAPWRYCRDCEGLRGGGSITRGNVRETWDEETQMPKREVVAGT